MKWKINRGDSFDALSRLNPLWTCREIKRISVSFPKWDWVAADLKHRNKRENLDLMWAHQTFLALHSFCHRPGVTLTRQQLSQPIFQRAKGRRCEACPTTRCLNTTSGLCKWLNVRRGQGATCGAARTGWTGLWGQIRREERGKYRRRAHRKAQPTHTAADRRRF